VSPGCGVKFSADSLGFAAIDSFLAGAHVGEPFLPGPFDVTRQLGRTASVDAMGESAFSAFLGWDAGEHHWNATLTGFAPTGYYSSTALAFTSS